jgi:hypothetical protein
MMGGRSPERYIAHSRNIRLAEKSCRQRRTEIPFEGGQSPEGAVVPRLREIRAPAVRQGEQTVDAYVM